jgi:DNA invertase Pin-like site-specific DNA recombinase
MLDRIAGNGVRTIIVESPDRFARDLAVQLAGHDHLRKLGVTLIPATAPDFFTEDTPTAILVRQVLGAIAQFEKATTVAKLKAARDRKIAAGEKCGGRKSYAEARPEMVELARQLRRPDPDRRPISLRKVAQKHLNIAPGIPRVEIVYVWKDVWLNAIDLHCHSGPSRRVFCFARAAMRQSLGHLAQAADRGERSTYR